MLSEHFVSRMVKGPKTLEEASDIVRGLMNRICDPKSKKLLCDQQNVPYQPSAKVQEGGKSWQPSHLLEEFHERAI